MKKNSIYLVKMLLLSTSKYNRYKYTRDSQKKKEILSNIIGTYCLYVMLAAYGFFMCMGYSSYGMVESIPLMCAVFISASDFILHFLRQTDIFLTLKNMIL